VTPAAVRIATWGASITDAASTILTPSGTQCLPPTSPGERLRCDTQPDRRLSTDVRSREGKAKAPLN
jgi:hypothetical protein